MRAVTADRSMPPWLPAGCCNTFKDDISLTDAQIALIDAWVEQGAPEGDPDTPGASLAPVGGLSRVDLTLQMPEPYLPEPRAGRVDDFRCFIVDWPLDEPTFVTGINPRPDARPVVHHLVIGAISPELAAEYEALSGQDGKPGFPCEGGLGELGFDVVLGGSLVGADFPEGMGSRVEPGSKILFNMHYSLAEADPEPDQTSVEFKLDDSGEPASTIVLANSGGRASQTTPTPTRSRTASSWTGRATPSPTYLRSPACAGTAAPRSAAPAPPTRPRTS